MEKGINLQEQIMKLYMNYYQGGLMKLVVIGGGTVFLLSCYILFILLCSALFLVEKEQSRYLKIFNKWNWIPQSFWQWK